MEKKWEAGAMKRLTDRLFGGIRMTWPRVLLFAVAAAVLTAVFLLVPVFEGTSFERMGVTFEAWIFFAVVIMANCEKPLESACKTFVFFLLSQPLIYLLQVPFSPVGWGLFGYYRYWFLWTLATFPMALVGWYIKRKNWLSLLILAPVLFILTNDYVGGFRDAVKHFPRMLVMALFCLGQVLVYLLAFTENRLQKLLGFLVPLAAVIVLLLVRPQIQLNATQFLPDSPSLTENAVVLAGDEGLAEISIASTGPDSMIRVHTEKYGETSFTIRDGETEYRYILVVYEDDGGHPQIRIRTAE